MCNNNCHNFTTHITRAHLVLTKLGIVHFLCLGGLWGQVRIGRALPWARKVELCLVDTLRDDVLITKAFREVGLSATYLHAAGIYRIQEHEVGEDAPKVEVVVFEEDAVVRSFWKQVLLYFVSSLYWEFLSVCEVEINGNSWRMHF